MKKQIVVTDFSGIYREEQFWKKENVSWMEAGDIPGTNCYCDGDAMEELKKRMKDFSPEGIHFLDSGNYHYMSRIWLEKINRPFRLLVFDNHTDMQLPAFGGLLSCGGWIASSLLEVENLKEVILVGPDEEAYSQVEAEFQERVRFISREELEKRREAGDILREGTEGLFSDFSTELPLYISIDKDVLGTKDAKTVWSQGDMTLDELLGLLKQVEKSFAKCGGEILGVDICGEGDAAEITAHGLNDRANRILLEHLMRSGEEALSPKENP